MPDFIPRKGQNPVDVFTALFQPIAKLTGDSCTLNKDSVVVSFIYRRKFSVKVFFSRKEENKVMLIGLEVCGVFLVSNFVQTQLYSIFLCKEKRKCFTLISL